MFSEMELHQDVWDARRILPNLRGSKNGGIQNQYWIWPSLNWPISDAIGQVPLWAQPIYTRVKG